VLQPHGHGAALRDYRAEVFVGDEPAVDVGGRAHGRRAGAELDQGHLAEHASRSQPRDREALAAGKGHYRLDVARAQHVGAACRVGMAHERRAGDEGDGRGYGQKQLTRFRIEALKERRR